MKDLNQLLLKFEFETKLSKRRFLCKQKVIFLPLI